MDRAFVKGYCHRIGVQTTTFYIDFAVFPHDDLRFLCFFNRLYFQCSIVGSIAYRISSLDLYDLLLQTSFFPMNMRDKDVACSKLFFDHGTHV